MTSAVLILLTSVAALAASTPALDYSIVKSESAFLSAVDDSVRPWPADSMIRLCAVRVEFVEDDLTGTTGNGKMESWFPDTLFIDPLPHDRRYFEDHLLFLENYYWTASKGHVTFAEKDIYPEGVDSAYTLPFPMWHYNYNSDDELLNQRLVELFIHSVEAASGDVDFTRYDAILVFHAGVGKDFSFDYDATPFDIPSAYISETDIDDYAGSVPPGVTRGLILPEGENQQEALEYGVELSLNGIMIKLFGNWLGLPDLFNTKTGQSGVGRWGMMDQGSGNMAALVPALPDAWSRVYMGWEEPLIHIPGANSDTLEIGRFGSRTAPEIIQLPVTRNEYYLLENRDADADSIGHVTLRDRGWRFMQIDRDNNIMADPDFSVAVEADRYDFGIPGSGILIWHIDEEVIEDGLETNTVNANPDHRGVDLVEADAAQDIGVEYGFATAGSGTELGIQEDAWWGDNRDHKEANGGTSIVRFNSGTYPAARMYDGSYTSLELSNFSDVAEVMTFTARNTLAEPGFPVAIPWHDGFTQPIKRPWITADLNADGQQEFYAYGGGFYTTDSLGNTFAIKDTLSIPPMLYGNPVDIDNDGRDEILLCNESGIGIVEQEGSEIIYRSSEAEPSEDQMTYSAQTDEGLRGFLRFNIAFPEEGQQTIFISFYDSMFDQVFRDSISVPALEAFLQAFNVEKYPAEHFLLLINNEAVCIAVTNSGIDELWRVTLPDIDYYSDPLTVLHEPNRISIFIKDFGFIDALTGEILCSYPDCISPEVDWDGDGIPGGGGLQGATSVNQVDFPLMTTNDYKFVDLTANGKPDIVEYEGFGNGFYIDYMLMSHSLDRLYSRVGVYLHDGQSSQNLPLAVYGVQNRLPIDWSSDPFLNFVEVHQFDYGLFYYTVNRLPIAARNAERFQYTDDIAIINVGDLNPQVHQRADWLYCWPNPTSDISHIRITVPYTAEAKVKIFDLAGRKIKEIGSRSDIAGPFEVDWNVRGVESGVYFGQVEVRGGGKSLHSQVKIAVVK